MVIDSRHRSPPAIPTSAGLETQVRQGQAVLPGTFAAESARSGPQLICAHPSWGEALFIRQAYPDAKLIDYCEFFLSQPGCRCRVRSGISSPGYRRPLLLGAA